MGGKLAEPESPGEMAGLRAMAWDVKQGSTWFGLRLIKGQWEFVYPGAKVKTFDWARGEPNNARGNEFCATLSENPGHNYRWNDDLCQRKHGYVCQLKKKFVS